VRAGTAAAASLYIRAQVHICGPQSLAHSLEVKVKEAPSCEEIV